MPRFRSLRIRLLLPLLGVALLASLCVAVGSYWVGDRLARDQALRRFAAVESTLAPASFPLTDQVIRSVATLTETELIAVDAEGNLVRSSFDITSPQSLQPLAEPNDQLRSTTIADQPFQYRTFARRSRLEEDDMRVVVLFDETRLQATRWRYALLPLVTGLSTVVLLTSVTLLLTARLVQRVARLRSQVDQIAEGDFHISVASDTSDELGMLGKAVSRMGDQLQTMWTTLNRQQGEKLLHQVAGGLAHQLRNSLTGARMAVELHQQQCHQADESLSVALAQLEQTESHVRRLLLVASGKQEQDKPQRVLDCLDEIRRTVAATAKHRHVELEWDIDPSLDGTRVGDGPTLHAAVTNLAINAMDEATRVAVVAAKDGSMLRVEVIDNGSGPPSEVADQLFEPFVTSKPEGLGLGLPLVMRSAQRLGGEVEWKRDQQRTYFILTLPLSDLIDSVAEPTQA